MSWIWIYCNCKGMCIEEIKIFFLLFFSFQFILQIEMSRTGFTKIVTLTPKYVIVNNTEVQNVQCSFIVQGSRCPGSECQQRNFFGSIPTVPSKSLSIYLSGHVTDPVGILTWEPYSFVIGYLQGTFILQVALRSNQSFSFNWHSFAILFPPDLGVVYWT